MGSSSQLNMEMSSSIANLLKETNIPLASPTMRRNGRYHENIPLFRTVSHAHLCHEPAHTPSSNVAATNRPELPSFRVSVGEHNSPGSAERSVYESTYFSFPPYVQSCPRSSSKRSEERHFLKACGTKIKRGMYATITCLGAGAQAITKFYTVRPKKWDGEGMQYEADRLPLIHRSSPAAPQQRKLQKRRQPSGLRSQNPKISSLRQVQPKSKLHAIVDTPILAAGQNCDFADAIIASGSLERSSIESSCAARLSTYTSVTFLDNNARQQVQSLQPQPLHNSSEFAVAGAEESDSNDSNDTVESIESDVNIGLPWSGLETIQEDEEEDGTGKDEYGECTGFEPYGEELCLRHSRCAREAMAIGGM